jgi:hypothetical protein
MQGTPGETSVWFYGCSWTICLQEVNTEELQGPWPLQTSTDTPSCLFPPHFIFLITSWHLHCSWYYAPRASILFPDPITTNCAKKCNTHLYTLAYSTGCALHLQIWGDQDAAELYSRDVHTSDSHLQDLSLTSPIVSALEFNVQCVQLPCHPVLLL